MEKFQSLGKSLSKAEQKRINGGYVFACKCPGADDWKFYSGISWAATEGSVSDCSFYVDYAVEMGEPAGVTCVMVAGGKTTIMDSIDQ